jgi:hypothetical protein
MEELIVSDFDSLTAFGIICTLELAPFEEGLVRGLHQPCCQLIILREKFIS